MYSSISKDQTSAEKSLITAVDDKNKDNVETTNKILHKQQQCLVFFTVYLKSSPRILHKCLLIRIQQENHYLKL